MKKQQAPFWKLPNAQDDYDCSMTNHLSQQLTVQSAQSTQLQKTEKTSCIIHDIAVLAVLLWLNLHLYLHYGFLFLSIVGNYHNNFKYIMGRFNCDCIQRPRQVILFCILGTKITQGFKTTKRLFIKSDIQNYFIFRVQSLLFLRCH